jgi:hypothetical protein
MTYSLRCLGGKGLGVRFCPLVLIQAANIRSRDALGQRFVYALFIVS